MLFLRPQGSYPAYLYMTRSSQREKAEIARPLGELIGKGKSSVVSDSLQPHRLYSPWNSPGLNTGVGSLSLLQGMFPTQGLNPGLLIAGGFFTT